MSPRYRYPCRSVITALPLFTPLVSCLLVLHSPLPVRYSIAAPKLAGGKAFSTFLPATATATLEHPLENLPKYFPPRRGLAGPYQNNYTNEPIHIMHDEIYPRLRHLCVCHATTRCNRLDEASLPPRSSFVRLRSFVRLLLGYAHRTSHTMSGTLKF